MQKKTKHLKHNPQDQARSARLLELLRAGRDQRGKMVRRIKTKIRARAYENPLKLQVCVDRLFDELAAK